MTQVRPIYRTMLFIPGTKTAWVDKGVMSRADALILDLEDAVGAGQKETARMDVAEAVRSRAAQPGGPAIWVRPNAWGTGLAGGDLDAVVWPGLSGLFLPKITCVADVIRFDGLITHFEIARGMTPGSVGVLIAIETAEAMVDCERLAKAPRVVTLLGSTSPAADVARALGFQWTPLGLESLYLRSRVVMACRAAGLNHPIGGLWEDVGDLVGLTAFTEQQRQLGFRGQIVIHPSHVQVVNAIFTPSRAQVDEARRLVAAYQSAVSVGNGAAVHDGQHIDYAHVQSALDIQALSEAIGARAAN